MHFLEDDYHYTEIFCPQAHFRYTTACCVYVFDYVYVFVDVYMFVYVFVYVCVFVYVRFSKNIIYDIGSEILSFHCFATKVLNMFCKSIVLPGSAAFF